MPSASEMPSSSIGSFIGSSSVKKFFTGRRNARNGNASIMSPIQLPVTAPKMIVAMPQYFTIFRACLMLSGIF